MTRWWADADQARDVLGRVDASDVEQGVGTAVLGYHALAAERLAPLSQRTLVDVSQVVRALEAVDLEPVAKALGEATRPVMGDAADRYGELLASDLHQQAVNSTERLVMNLSSTGMPFPTAISRALAVHGLPEDRMGRVHLRLRQPVIQPLALDDAADRALMEYASHVGRREATSAEVSKAGVAREWDESEVKRDRLGQFAREGAPAGGPPPGPPTDDRAARLARLKARKQRKAGKLQRVNAAQAQKKTEAAPAAEPRQQRMSLSERMAARRAAQVEEAEEAVPAGKSRVKEAIKRKIDRKMRDYIKKLTDDPDGPPPPPPERSMKDSDDYPTDSGRFLDAHKADTTQTMYFPVRVELLNRIAKDGGFNAKTLAVTANSDPAATLWAFNAEEASRNLGNLFMNQVALGGYGIVMFDRDMGLTMDHTPDDSAVVLANQSTYDVLDKDADRGIRFDDELGLTRKIPGTDQRIPVKMAYLRVRLENTDKFDQYVHKADRPWNEAAVERDARGRFAEEDENGVKARQERLQRLKARKAGKRTKMQRVTRQAAEAPAQAKEQRGGLTERLAARAATKQQEVDAEIAQEGKTSGKERIKEALRRKIQKQIEQKLNVEKDLESLYTIQFATDDAALPDWFGVGGFDGPDFTGGPEDDFEEQLIKDTIRAQMRPAPEVMLGIHDSLNTDNKAFKSGIAGYDEGSAFFYDITDAQAMAESWLEDNEPFVRQQFFTVVPYTKEMTHTHYGQGFQSRWALVPENPDRTMVFGSKRDFQRILDGEDFEATRMGGGSANVWFDTILARSVPREDYEARLEQGRRPDFKVRAFRLRMRENDPDRD